MRLFELTSNPEVSLADAEAYYAGEITLQELADRSKDTVTGKSLSTGQAQFLAAVAVRVKRAQKARENQ